MVLLMKLWATFIIVAGFVLVVLSGAPAVGIACFFLVDVLGLGLVWVI